MAIKHCFEQIERGLQYAIVRDSRETQELRVDLERQLTNCTENVARPAHRPNHTLVQIPIRQLRLHYARLITRFVACFRLAFMGRPKKENTGKLKKHRKFMIPFP